MQACGWTDVAVEPVVASLLSVGTKVHPSTSGAAGWTQVKVGEGSVADWNLGIVHLLLEKASCVGLVSSASPRSCVNNLRRMLLPSESKPRRDPRLLVT